jgi:hypothetical protein
MIKVACNWCGDMRWSIPSPRRVLFDQYYCTTYSSYIYSISRPSHGLYRVRDAESAIRDGRVLFKYKSCLEVENAAHIVV